MRRGLAWAALAALVAWAIYGFVHERLLSQEIWNRDGRIRLLGYTIVYWAVAGVILWRWPRWLAAAAAGFAFVYSTWWCWRFYNPLAPIAVLYFLGSSYLLGRLALRWVTPVVRGIHATLVGLAIWIFLISLAVHFPINRPWVYAVAFAIP